MSRENKAAYKWPSASEHNWLCTLSLVVIPATVARIKRVLYLPAVSESAHPCHSYGTSIIRCKAKSVLALTRPSVCLQFTVASVWSWMPLVLRPSVHADALSNEDREKAYANEHELPGSGDSRWPGKISSSQQQTLSSLAP